MSFFFSGRIDKNHQESDEHHLENRSIMKTMEKRRNDENYGTINEQHGQIDESHGIFDDFHGESINNMEPQ